MGCFLGCFGAPKDGKRGKPTRRRLPREQVYEQYKPLRLSPSPKQLPEQISPLQLSLSPNKIRPLQLSLSPKDLPAEVPANAVPDLRDVGQIPSFSRPNKRVTFDLNVKIYEDVTFQEDENYPVESDQEKEELALISTRGEGKPQNEESNSTLSSLGAYPSNHRYQNCTSSDNESSEEEEDEEEGEEEDYEDCDFDDEDDVIDGIENGEEESFDSYFSLPMDKERETYKEVSSVKAICSSPDRKPTLLSKQNARDRSQYIHSVLNPVENIYQWKEVKARATPPKHPKKENINLEQEPKIPICLEPSFKLSKPQKSFESNPSSNFDAKQEVSVDTSLSNWLPSLENTPDKGPRKSSSSCQSNSSVSFDDRPILGALTVEELKQSASSSPRKSPSRSPDEIPILGTVGSYWNHTNQKTDSSSSHRSGSSGAKGIPNTTSKYREDKIVNWHSTPFEERLERALNREAAESCPSCPHPVC